MATKAKPNREPVHPVSGVRLNWSPEMWRRTIKTGASVFEPGRKLSFHSVGLSNALTQLSVREAPREAHEQLLERIRGALAPLEAKQRGDFERRFVTEENRERMKGLNLFHSVDGAYGPFAHRDGNFRLVNLQSGYLNVWHKPGIPETFLGDQALHHRMFRAVQRYHVQALPIVRKIVEEFNSRGRRK